MPTAPRIQIGSVQATRVPSVRFTPNATAASFGGKSELSQFGEALGYATDALARSVIIQNKEAVHRRDTAIARDKYTQASSEANQYLMDVYMRNGEDAVNAYPDVEKQLQEISKKYEEQMVNPVQREYFKASFSHASEQHLNRTALWVQGKRKEYEQETLMAENQLAVETAVAMRTDPASIREAEITISLNTASQYKGFPSEVKQKKIADAKNNLHSAVVAALVVDSPIAAQGYLEKNWDKFNPIAREALKVDLAEKAELATVRNISTAISSSGKTYEEQLAEVDKIKDPKRADAVRKRVKDTHDERQQLKEAQQVEKFESVVDDIFKDPTNAEIPSDLSAQQQEKLYDLGKKLRKDKAAARGASAASETDWSAYYELKGMPPEQFRNVDLLDYADRLKESELKELIKEQRDERGGRGKGLSVRTPYQNAMSVVKTLPIFKDDNKGWADVKKNQKGVAKQNQFLAQFEARLNQLPEEQRTAENQDKIIKDLLTPTPIVRFGPIPNTPALKFEIPYMNTDDQKRALKHYVPEPLKVYPNVQFDEDTERYFVDGDGVRDIYDQYGNYVTSYRRQD